MAETCSCIYIVNKHTHTRYVRRTYGRFIVFNTYRSRTGIGQSVKRLASGWTVQGSIPGKDEIIHTRPDRPWGPTSLLCSGYRVPFPETERPGRGVDQPPTFSAEVTGEQSYTSAPPLCLHGLFYGG
jgi:hypothetical protein